MEQRMHFHNYNLILFRNHLEQMQEIVHRDKVLHHMKESYVLEKSSKRVQIQFIAWGLAQAIDNVPRRNTTTVSQDSWFMGKPMPMTTIGSDLSLVQEWFRTNQSYTRITNMTFVKYQRYQQGKTQYRSEE
jgi:hypothetical protein